jgi:hypothetical protein
MEELKQAYRNALPSIEQISAQNDGVSGPLLMEVPDSYRRASVRLMIIGQQTYGWPSVTVELDELLRTYTAFDLGREYYSSPFWQASHQVFRAVNPDGPDRAFLWSNLVRVDQHRERPSAEIEDAVSGLGLLNCELQILKPDAAVFFTGPHYDDRLRQTFPGVRYHELAQDVVRLQHQDLPAKSFRTYHPRYLWQAKKRAALTSIADAILVA